MHPYEILDVFTDVPLQGNPLAVFTDAGGFAEELLQPAARELNLSETVFVLGPGTDTGAHARIRIFTPAAELPFAGHPVLGTAFSLGRRLELETVRLATAAGIVPVRLSWEGEHIRSGEMSQPVPEIVAFEQVPELLASLGVERSGLPVEIYRNGPRHVYVELETEAAVAALSPNFQELAKLGGLGVNCYAIAPGGAVKARNFSPGLGVAEDPATGSAAGPLAVHLARHGRIGFGQEIAIRQGEEIGRPSQLRARVEGTSERLQQVLVSGAAVFVARGEFRLS
ncbi:MAG: PhzF family phenazine biosynthesis protein [Solirubrobacteraceae bacterium]